MAFSKLHPAEARSSGTSNAPRGKVSGKGPGPSGHPVRGKGTNNASRGTLQANTPKSGGTRVGGKGLKFSTGANTGKSGRY